MWSVNVDSVDSIDFGSYSPSTWPTKVPQDEPQVNTNQIVPESLIPQDKPLVSPIIRPCASFRDIFGVFGPVLVVIVIISIIWTTWLVVLAIAPNSTANYLMDTTAFDDGQFWLIVDPDFKLKILGVIGLVAVDVCYLYIFLNLVSSRICSSKSNGSWRWKFTFVFCDRISACWSDITGIRGKYRKYWVSIMKTTHFYRATDCLVMFIGHTQNVSLKCVDLVMQTIMLCQLLQDGSSTILVMGYAIFLCANSFSVAVTILLGNSEMDKISTNTFYFVVLSSFDLVAAVLYPILVLLYSANNFDFDRKLFSVNLEILPPGSFERNARLFVDPAERALFVTSLNSLRILSFTDLFLRLSMNFAFCVRFISVINLMVNTAKKENGRLSTWESLGELFVMQRRVPRPYAALFLVFGVGAVVYAHKCINASQSACAPYAECVVHAYQWRTGDICPCRTLVDVYRTPQTFLEWSEPVDVYDNVKALSQSGMLHNLQLINRALTRWPEELQKCKDLQSISLIYTETEWFPEWAKSWNNLQFLHIEGKQLRPSLTELPDGLFDNMPFLQMIHLGVHPVLPRIPALDGTPNLRSLTLAGLYIVTELPSFEYAPEIQRLTLSYMESLQTIPDLSPLKNLISFVILSICPVCCNGFISTCNSTDWFCLGKPDIQVSQSACLDENAPHASAVSQSIFKEFAPSVCIRSGFDVAETVDLLSEAQIAICDGVLYRRCEFPPHSGKFGICMNNRLQALMCVVNQDYIRLREVQIQRNVGPPCDVREEAWLGCHG
ncbi:putative membrane protein [Phytophthora megakarya]|uniref:Putative membrane protein n=1 Tax=Phytophthora megakarya TaxID=4795 RepID=A0A225VAK1_9STRA|nr:putative membrane protein [Phytophthora megakarya]